MFVYENGLIVDYAYHNDNPYVEQAVRQHMLDWARGLGGQSRVRLGKVGQMQGSSVDLKRMEHE